MTEEASSIVTEIVFVCVIAGQMNEVLFLLLEARLAFTTLPELTPPPTLSKTLPPCNGSANDFVHCHRYCLCGAIHVACISTLGRGSTCIQNSKGNTCLASIISNTRNFEFWEGTF